MNAADPVPEPPLHHTPLREIITDALRYWEPRRLLYNAALVVIVLAYFFVTLPQSRASLTINDLLFLFVLAVLANVCYCAAYVADVFAQLSGFRAVWRRWRGGLLVVGIVLAGIITRLFALEFFLRTDAFP